MVDGSRVTVLEEDGSVLGSAKMGPNRPGRGATSARRRSWSPPPHAVAARSAPAEDMVAWHREQGFAGIQFTPWSRHTGAVRLWQDLGFTIVGTVPGAFESTRHGRVGLQ